MTASEHPVLYPVLHVLALVHKGWRTYNGSHILASCMARVHRCYYTGPVPSLVQTLSLLVSEPNQSASSSWIQTRRGQCQHLNNELIVA